MKNKDFSEKKSGLKILIVEDDFVCRKVLQMCLSEFGDCFIAVNGQEAVEAVGDNVQYSSHILMGH